MLKPNRNIKPTGLIKPWEYDIDFYNLFSSIKKNSVVGLPKCWMLYQFAKNSINLNGDTAELGVYKGGTAKLISQVLAHKTLHLFDTFCGMPSIETLIDIHKAGDFNDTSLSHVKNLLMNCNVKFYPGIFPETTKDLENFRYCFVHIDADLYKPHLDALKYFWPRMVRNGIIIFDDYGAYSCPGAKKAVDEFFRNERNKIIWLTTGQAFVQKN